MFLKPCKSWEKLPNLQPQLVLTRDFCTLPSRWFSQNHWSQPLHSDDHAFEVRLVTKQPTRFRRKQPFLEIWGSIIFWKTHLKSSLQNGQNSKPTTQKKTYFSVFFCLNSSQKRKEGWNRHQKIGNVWHLIRYQLVPNLQACPSQQWLWTATIH